MSRGGVIVRGDFFAPAINAAQSGECHSTLFNHRVLVGATAISAAYSGEDHAARPPSPPRCPSRNKRRFVRPNASWSLHGYEEHQAHPK
jgi:hypothetical protein